MKKNGIILNAIILSVGAVLAKIFSAVYRIALTRVLGGVGIGLYQLIFPLYSLCVVLSTAGLPMAISKVVAKYKGCERSVVKKCIIFTSVISISLSFLLVCFSKGLSAIQGEPKLSICYIILAPTLIILSASSVLRGYFQGIGNFTPSAVSNIFEQFVKLILGLGLSLWLLNYGLIASIVGAMVGIVISEIISFAILVFCYRRKGKKEHTSLTLRYKELFKDILPITMTNIILPLASFIDSLVVVNLLSVSFSQDVAVFLYGLESGAVASLVGIPTIFSFALASVILPSLSGVEKGKNKNRKLTLTIKIVLLISVPCALAFMIMPNRLVSLLYANRLNSLGINGIKIASNLLAISGVGVVFLSLNQILSSSLQAINQRKVTVRNLIIAVVIKFIIEFLFLSNKILNINILVYANTVCYFTVFILNLIEIKIHFKLDINYVFITKLALCNCFMLFVMLQFLLIGESAINTLVSAFFAIIIYFLSVIFLDVFEVKEKEKLKYIKK